MTIRHAVTTVGALALLSLGTGTMMLAQPQQGAAPAPGSTAKPARNERHPEIHKAIAALEHAKAHLQSAAHDFGGHRADALAACDKAIEQLKLALQYDK